MPGFLAASGYDGTTRIDLGNGYWVTVKNCLTSAEKAFADDLMGARQQIDTGGQRQFAEMNYTAYRKEMVVHSITDWNLDDEDGTVWPLDAGGRFAGAGVGVNPYPPGCPRRASVNRLPDPVFQKVLAVVDELNAPRKGADAASFPDRAVVGDPDGDGGAAGLAAVPHGAGDVAAVRADQGGDGAAPAP